MNFQIVSLNSRDSVNVFRNILSIIFMLRTMFFVFKKRLLLILKYFVLFLKPGVGLVSGLPLLENEPAF